MKLAGRQQGVHALPVTFYEATKRVVFLYPKRLTLHTCCDKKTQASLLFEEARPKQSQRRNSHLISTVVSGETRATMTATRIVSSSDDVVVKSPNDRRLYRTIELENGLCALLVHDPEIYPDGSAADAHNTDGDEHDEDEYGSEDEDSEGSYEEDDEDDEDGEDEEEEDGEADEERGNTQGGSQTKKAAAAMCVSMGSFLDPREAQGLAHFLEHMLFMGSSEFPDENEYDSYLSKHGGSSNAYTEMEHTCYHFEVKREFLKGALKRFSQFFVSPLMKVEAMEREVLAVDSEFNQALQSDACRLQQLQCHTSGTNHPFNKFAWGNKKSLSDAMERGVNLRDCIMKLYKEHYHGGLMKLVVIGGESLDVLESWVVELFADVKKGPQIRPPLKAEGPIWKAGNLYRLEAVKDVHILDLIWTLPSLRHAYLKKPEDYLAHLLGHEGRGSLHSFLKGKGWATSLSAGVGDEGLNRSSLAYNFSMSIHLTDSGLEKIYDIIGYVYQYLKLLRDVSPQEWIFKELQNIGNMDFRYAEEQPQDDYAAELAENMLAYPVEHVIYGDYVYTTWDPEMIKYLLGFFTPENMRIDVVSKSIKSQDFQHEPWFGSRYVEEDVPSSLMEAWKNPSEIDTSLHLPAKNEFIPCDFSIRAMNSDGDSKNQSPPRCIIDKALMKLWYKLDETFKVPRANTYFRINLKGGYDSVKNCLLTELFINLLKDELNETIYQASVAKLETSLSMYGDKLELKVYGFNDKLPALLSEVLTVAKSFIPTLERFKVIKENMERGLKNTNMKPLNHSSYLRLQLLCKRFYDADEKLSVLNDLSLADLTTFIPELRSQIFIEALCHGNLSEEEANNISNIFKSSLMAEPLPSKFRHEEHITCFPLGSNLVRDVSVKNKSETNSVVELYYQIDSEEAQSTRMKAILDLFDEIIEEPLFNQLRTKEQLGYVVECGPRLTYRIHGFCFCVQSSKYSPIYLLERIDGFITSIDELLEQLDDKSFEDYRSGMIAKLLEKDPSLSYETNRLWGQIVDKRYMFDFSVKEAEELRSIQKKDVVDWYRTYLTEPSPKCRKLAVRVWGCNTDMNEGKSVPKSAEIITDVAAFKSSSQFYPSLC
ncbi:PREDICTED: nardilysin-like [Tarenaya hassleriana]|uniref:nardilysin-like n=1 Tax=Tarenaya hassleriana TaxID=28532 RepID=UPI00053C9CBB|nr:PREDICTED: nardilysin-like [Tarenaya hassleriana]